MTTKKQNGPTVNTEAARRDWKLAAAIQAHCIKPNVPLSWLWLLEWASGQELLRPIAEPCQ